MTYSANAPVLVVIPKRDELRSAALVFGFNADEPDRLLMERYSMWSIECGSLQVNVICPNEQGSDKLAVATQSALSDGDYSVAMCVGTAAGRVGRTNYLDVILATNALDLQEWRSSPEGLEPQWTGVSHPPSPALDDIDDFVKNKAWRESCRDTLVGILPLPVSEEVAEVIATWPRVDDSWVVTTSILHANEKFLNEIWKLHARLRTVDMETAGFVLGCESGRRKVPWFVFRSVSDFGTKESKRDDLRGASGAAAAAVCQSFIQSGLKQSHPLRLARVESESNELSGDNFFAKSSMSQFLLEQIQARIGHVIDRNTLTSGTTVSDLKHVLTDFAPKVDTEALLDQIREDYYTSKYLNYRDEADVRGETGNAWLQDVELAFRQTGVNLAGADVLYVGVGTGRDLKALFPRVKSLTGVDLSRAMLAEAEKRYPALSAIRASAETLSGIDALSVDLYISLRTFQSSLFDTTPALRHAARVLRPGGSLIVSLPSGFLETAPDGAKTWLPGLLVPGTRVMDRALPRKIADAIQTELEHLMFERIGFHQLSEDLYIYARKRGS